MVALDLSGAVIKHITGTIDVNVTVNEYDTKYNLTKRELTPQSYKEYVTNLDKEKEYGFIYNVIDNRVIISIFNRE